jgi:hypothetical protein
LERRAIEIVGNKERGVGVELCEVEVEDVEVEADEEGEAIWVRISSDGNARVARSVSAA